MRDGDNIRQVAALGVDWIGMIFWEKSPRHVTMLPTHAGIIPDRTGSEMAACTDGRPFVRVGLFADEMAQNVITRVVNYQLDVVLFTGSESPTLLRNLRRTLDPGTIRRAIRFWKFVDKEPSADAALRRDYADSIDAFVTKSGDSLTTFPTSIA